MEANDDTKKITVLIGEKSYMLRISARHEKEFRRTVGEINEKINDFQVAHPQVTQQDCMAMILLTYAADLKRLQNNPSLALQQEREDFAADLARIDVLLDNLLAE